MYPTLAHLIKDVFGMNTPFTMSTFAFFFLLAILVAYRFLDKELKRKAQLRLLNGSYDNSGTYRRPEDQAIPIIFFALFFGLVGARIFAIVKYAEPFSETPFTALFSLSDLSYYGGFIFGVAAVIFYAHRIGLNKYHTLDAAAPALMFAYAIGRLGCYLSGNGNWGITNNNPKPEWLSFLPDALWSHNYPHNIMKQGVAIPGCTDDYCTVLPGPVFPTSLYEFLICTLAFILIWKLRKKTLAPGLLFSIYLLFGGFERLMVEQIKTDVSFKIFRFSIEYSEFISALLMLTGIFMILYYYVKRRIF
jgi:phosphatidylglycerol:prolipoprotein diacylglycerol transferase